MTIKIKQHKDTEAELKRLMFEAVPYIERSINGIDLNPIQVCEGIWFLNEIKEALEEKKAK